MQIKEPLPQNALFSTSYTSSSGLMTPDVEPRVISNRISVEAANNSAAVIPQAISFTILGVGFQNPTQAAGPP